MKNTVTHVAQNGNEFLFSYGELVAAFVSGRGILKSDLNHSRTTACHISAFVKATGARTVTVIADDELQALCDVHCVYAANWLQSDGNGGTEPVDGCNRKRKLIGHFDTYVEAKTVAQEWNDANEPGKLSRKAEIMKGAYRY